MRRKPLFTILLLAALLAASSLAPAARASRTQESLFEDETSLLYSGQATRDATLDELQALGVDTIRANVVWNKYAPDPTSPAKPAFDASDPGQYPFADLDALVAGAQQRGMNVQLTPTGPGPGWASDCPGSYQTRRICSPNPGEYGAFVTALGRRYPTVTRWSVWNEPNQGGWLTPQWARHGSKYYPESPRRYRQLVYAATDALAASGHAGDQILLGETAPLGRSTGSYATRSLPPADFYRELFCLDSRGRALTGSSARVRGCESYRRLDVTGVAHHPYTRAAGQDPRSRVGSSDITLSTISRLSLWIDRGAARGRVARGLPIWVTEYGFQTNPPDRTSGTSLSNQATWLNESDWMAWNNPRIRSVAQYELRDESDLGAFQTGLRFVGGGDKPGLAAYKLPIWPVATRTGTKIWLQVRPQSRLGGSQTVTIEYLPAHARAYKTLGTYSISDPRGFLYKSARVKAAYWRFSWNGQTSRKARAESR